MKHHVFWATPLLFAYWCSAQSATTRPALPDGGARLRLVSIFIPNLPNSPFSATVNTEWVRTLGNGARITLVNHRLIARDSMGRVFQERRMLVPENSDTESIVNQTEISDPILKQKFICFPTDNTCRLEFREPITGASQDQRDDAADAGAQPLGTQIIDGLQSVGTRETVIIAANEIGNDSPLKTTREFWFSPKLGINLISIRDDPRFGTQRFILSDIVLGEPDSKLFSPPESSRILDLRRPASAGASKSDN